MGSKPIRTVLRTFTQPLTLSAALLAAASLAQAEEVKHESHMRNGSHSQHQPANIQLGHIHHVHQSGSWMFEYRYMRMEMDELLTGSNNVSASSVAKMGSPYKNANGTNYMMAPTSMTMDMHMLMGMYSQTDDLSWMVMLNYLDNKMNMVAMNGSRPVMNASGLGDVQIGAMYKLYDNGPSQLLANIVVSLPAGSIDKANNLGLLPYAMQLGSGTYDLIPSLTYQNNYGVWSWGLQGSFVFRLNENSQNYALGNRADGQFWVKATPLKNTSITGRVSLSHWEGISGSSNAISMMQRNMSPTFDTRNSGGDRLDLSIGLSQMFDSGHMLGFEYGIPVQQSLDGLQMKVKQVYSISWQYMF